VPSEEDGERCIYSRRQYLYGVESTYIADSGNDQGVSRGVWTLDEAVRLETPHNDGANPAVADEATSLRLISMSKPGGWSVPCLQKDL
jgi:hypothetical protein